MSDSVFIHCKLELNNVNKKKVLKLQNKQKKNR